MHILCTTDDNYIMPTGVMIKSVSVNNSDTDIIFHIIIDESVKEYHKEELRSVISDKERHLLEFYVVNDTMFDSFPSVGSVKKHITKACYYRLIVSDILPNSINKIIYLDCDVIVDKSLSQLWNFDIEDYGIGAVTDMSEFYQDYERLGYSCSLGYFNSGVLLINLKYWRANDIINKFKDLIRYHSDRIEQHDQDVLNIVFAKRKVVIPFKYNVQNGFLYRKEFLGIDAEKYNNDLIDVRKNQVIVHYVSMVKPWHKECNHPLRNLWFKYLKQTRWYRYKPIRKFPVSAIGNMLRFVKILPPLPPLHNPFIPFDN